jgi:hypothetical protein
MYVSQCFSCPSTKRHENTRIIISLQIFNVKKYYRCILNQTWLVRSCNCPVIK